MRRFIQTLSRNPQDIIGNACYRFYLCFEKISFPVKNFGYRIIQKRSADAIRKLECFSALEENSKGAFAPRYDDLYLMYKETMKASPTCILEYGSGCSTIIFAQAIHDIYKKTGIKGKIISIENNSKWAQNTLSIIPDNLKEYAEVRVLNASVLTVDAKIKFKEYQQAWYGFDSRAMRLGCLTLSYPDLFDLKPDFIYLDGPDPRDIAGYSSDENKAYPAIVSDPCFMEKEFNIGTTILVDGRQPNCVYLYSNFIRDWKISKHSLQNCTIFKLIK